MDIKIETLLKIPHISVLMRERGEECSWEVFVSLGSLCKASPVLIEFDKKSIIPEAGICTFTLDFLLLVNEQLF